MELKPAAQLEDIHKVVSPLPLQTQEELNAFYRPELNQIRGGDRIKRLQLHLSRAWKSTYSKLYFMGHLGSGKTTELNRLVSQIQNQYRVIYISIVANLDPANFQPLDLVLIMMVRVVEMTTQSSQEGGIGQTLSAKRLQEIIDWFSTEKISLESTRTSDLGSWIRLCFIC